MPRLRAILALAVLLAPAVAEAQSDPAIWRFVHPNVRSLVSINWQRIRQSPTGAMIREKWPNANLMAAIPGLELLDEIDRVVISTPGNETPDDTIAESARPPLLIMVRGHFNAVRVRQLFARLGGKAQAYNSFQVYRPQAKDSRNMAYVLFDAGTILFGDAPTLFAVLDRNQFEPPAPEPGSIVARAAEMDAAYDVSWVMSTPGMPSSDWLADLFRAVEWAPDAQGFEVGVSLRSGLAADVTVRFASEAAAKQVVTEMTRLTAMVAKDKQAAQIQDLAKKLKFTSDGSAAKIGLRLTLPELEKSAQLFAASTGGFAAAGGVSRAAAPAAVPAPVQPPAPAKPGVIRIEGLDDGPREIPYPVPRH